jgi:hypothetical protein
MIQSGMIREGLMVTRAVYDRYDGRLRSGLTSAATASWGYSGNPFGDDECGKFYARAMSVWSILLACQGFVYDGPAGLIGFKPVWKPEDHASFFTGAEGWGLFTQCRKDGRQIERIEVRYGKLRVKSLVFQLPEKTVPVEVKVQLDGQSVPAKQTGAGSLLKITLAKPAVIPVGGALDVNILWEQGE